MDEKSDLQLLTEEYLRLKPELSPKAQEFYLKVSQLLWQERLAKNMYRQRLAKILGIRVERCINDYDPEPRT